MNLYAKLHRNAMQTKNKIRLAIIFLTVIGIFVVSSMDEIKVKPDFVINVSDNNFRHISHYEQFMMQIGTPNPFKQVMSWDFDNIQPTSEIILTTKQKVYNYLGFGNYPNLGDDIYAEFTIESLSTDKPFSYFIDYYLIDEMGYVIGAEKKTGNTRDYKYYVKLEPKQKDELIVKVNIPETLDDGKYYVLMLFKYCGEDDNYCYEKDADRRFYYIQEFEMNTRSRDLFKVVIALTLFGLFFLKIPDLINKLEQIYRDSMTKNVIKIFVREFKNNENFTIFVITLIALLITMQIINRSI